MGDQGVEKTFTCMPNFPGCARSLLFIQLASLIIHLPSSATKTAGTEAMRRVMTPRQLSLSYLFPLLPPPLSRGGRCCGGNLSNGRRSGSGLSNGSRGSAGLAGGCAAGGGCTIGGGCASGGCTGGRGSGLSNTRIGGDGASDGADVDDVLAPYILGRLNGPLMRKRAKIMKKRRRTTIITTALFSLTIATESRSVFLEAVAIFYAVGQVYISTHTGTDEIVSRGIYSIQLGANTPFIFWLLVHALTLSNRVNHH